MREIKLKRNRRTQPNNNLPKNKISNRIDISLRIKQPKNQIFAPLQRRYAIIFLLSTQSIKTETIQATGEERERLGNEEKNKVTILFCGRKKSKTPATHFPNRMMPPPIR